MPQRRPVGQIETRPGEKGERIHRCIQIEPLNLSNIFIWPSSSQQTTQSVPFRTMDWNPNPNGGFAGYGTPPDPEAPQGYNNDNPVYWSPNPLGFRNAQSNDASFEHLDVTSPGYWSESGLMDSFNYNDTPTSSSGFEASPGKIPDYAARSTIKLCIHMLLFGINLTVTLLTPRL